MYVPNKIIADFHWPVFFLIAGFPFLSIEPSSVIGEMSFFSSIASLIALSSLTCIDEQQDEIRNRCVCLFVCLFACLC